MWRQLLHPKRLVAVLTAPIERASLVSSISTSTGDANISAELSVAPDLHSLGSTDLKRKENIRTKLSRPDRFQSIDQRSDVSVVSLEATKLQCAGRNITRYRGYDVTKAPEEFVIYQQLFEHAKPNTIIELQGVENGASALWIADMLNLVPPRLVKPQVYSMLPDVNLVEPRIKELQPDNLHFVQGDCHRLEKSFTPQLITTLHRPMVVIDNHHENPTAALAYFHQFFHPGDYFIIENTNPNIPLLFRGDMHQRTGGKRKLDSLRQFLEEHKDRYAVDSFYTDFFGYNATSNWHGFIRRMK